MLDPSTWTFAIPGPDAHPRLLLRVHLPASYPSQHPPISELACDFLSADVLGGLAAELEAQFSPGACHGLLRGGVGVPRGCTPPPCCRRCMAATRALASLSCCAAGEVVLYNWLEHLLARWADLAPPQQDAGGGGGGGADADAAPAAQLQAAELLEGGGEGGEAGAARQERAARGAGLPVDAELEAAMADVAATVVHGEPVTERRSTFQARADAGRQHVQGRHALLAAAAAAAVPAPLIAPLLPLAGCRRTWRLPPAPATWRR